MHIIRLILMGQGCLYYFVAAQGCQFLKMFVGARLISTGRFDKKGHILVPQTYLPANSDFSSDCDDFIFKILNENFGEFAENFL